MTTPDREECRERAIAAGALKPQGVFERAAAGHMAYNDGARWADTALAQQRLAIWIEDCLNDRPFSRLR